jgi:2-polyprenyl-3-methyl-5-hydroxy-6-metoxy-1,4-benzoquinol methylase
MNHNELLSKRVEAAYASGGTSSGPILDAASRLLNAHGCRGELLEFGAGTGDFLKHLLTSGFPGRMTGTDLLPRPILLPEEVVWIQADLNHPLASVPDDSFDAIISTEVIEHLENPRAMIREFWRLLKPGGKVILTTPNQESLRSLLALLFSGHYAAFQDSCYPAHITALLRKDLRRIFAEAGFQGLEFSYTDHGYVPKWTRRTFQQISAGCLRGRWFSDNLLLVATKPTGNHGVQSNLSS